MQVVEKCHAFFPCLFLLPLSWVLIPSSSSSCSSSSSSSSSFLSVCFLSRTILQTEAIKGRKEGERERDTPQHIQQWQRRRKRRRKKTFLGGLLLLLLSLRLSIFKSSFLLPLLSQGSCLWPILPLPFHPRCGRRRREEEEHWACFRHAKNDLSPPSQKYMRYARVASRVKRKKKNSSTLNKFQFEEGATTKTYQKKIDGPTHQTHKWPRNGHKKQPTWQR